MSLAVDLLQLLGGQVSVSLGGGEAAMTQQLLDGAQVRPSIEQMGGKGMAQGMGGDMLSQGGEF